MNIAFYAPLKSPAHCVPSGDRLIARQLFAALQAIGHRVELASTLRSWDATGDSSRQERVRQLGDRIVAQLVERYLTRPAAQRPNCWFTYHLYHKAPDWLGPPVSACLNIPYVVAEASYAHKQRTGPWQLGYRAAYAAIGQADLLLSLNSTDIDGVKLVARQQARVVSLPPFLDTQEFAGEVDKSRATLSVEFAIPAGPPWVIAIAMMRPGNKLASYQVLAKAMSTLTKRAWHLLVVGDGQARVAVEQAFAGLSPARVTFLGQQRREMVISLLRAADLFAWPAVDEPLGMVFLEAQAAGLPVIAGNSRGVADLVENGQTGRLVEAGDEVQFAAAVASLLDSTVERERLGRQGQASVRARHDLHCAYALLGRELDCLVS